MSLLQREPSKVLCVSRRPQKVIPIRPYVRLSDEQQEIADLAFEFWLARCFREDGLPEQSLWRAFFEVKLREGYPASRARLLLVPKPHPSQRSTRQGFAAGGNATENAASPHA
jgi:hypothetical protein